ncbi:hypothetical protein ACUNV4_25350 [Granulosicoccus sp. 3-233]|uniref:hypothetical protein n=1 Tax=Granulosicoccus sp. 3-233 TaxID=3417969 RepID=UPI003D3262A9
MKVSNTLTAITAAGMLTMMSLGNVALADASDAAKVEATELQSDIQLHPMLGSYGISVNPMEDGTLAIEGIVDDQQAFDALNQLIEERTESSNTKIENNVARS